MYKIDLKKTQLDNYQTPQVSVITLHTEQTILTGSVNPDDFAPEFGFGEDGETPID